MTLLEMFLIFFKIGLFTVGGGYGILPLIHDELIENHLLTSHQLTNFVGLSVSLPGPFAVNVATFLGIDKFGIIGGIIAVLSLVLPSFIIIIFIAKNFESFKQNRYVMAALNSLKPIVLGLIASAALVLAIPTFYTKTFNTKAIIIFVIVFLSTLKFKLHPISLVVISAILGIAFYSF